MLRKFASIVATALALAAAPAFAADYKALDATAARLMAEGKIPGLAFAVIEHGKVVHVSAQGFRNVEKKLPLTPDTILYAASISKAAFAHYVLSLPNNGCQPGQAKRRSGPPVAPVFTPRSRIFALRARPG